ncbi:FAD-dependent monooxygenase [Streptomyces sp. NPDC050625]|uniref:FAD-dependent monooxygenase n=1 Tax=Streptomyces sp. NPDC050625 TaxID=3154629 RepID=UPI00342C4D41
MQIVVVGGGIGGLAAALGLRRAGHRVTVLERAREIAEVGAGIGLAPNAAAALGRLGVGHRLERTAVRPRFATRRRWQDGSDLFVDPLADVEERYGAPFWFAHRGDLQAALLAEAEDEPGVGEPVTVVLGAKCESVDAQTGVVLTAAGEYRADLVIGADGIRSAVRETVFGPVTPRYSGETGYRTQVQTDAALADPLLRDLVERNGFESWLGPNGHVVHCRFRGGREINVTACMQAPPISTGASAAQVDRSELMSALEGWSPVIRRLAELGGDVIRYDLFDIDPVESWVDGKVGLLGDAAHAMIPYLGQGAAQAIEDGEYLMRVFPGVDPSGVDGALKEYERGRKERAVKVQTTSRNNAGVFHMPDGPEQEARDARIRRGATDANIYDWLWRLPTRGGVAA